MYWRLLLLAALALFARCSPPEKSHSSVARLNLGHEPSTLDPRKGRDLNSFTLAKMLFDGLTRIGKGDKAELALASSVSFSSDMKKYTFYLRDALWSNGDPVTAFDFVYTWKKILDPGFLSDFAFQLYVIKGAKAAKEGKCSFKEIGVRALDERTLEVELEYPIPYFLELASLPIFFPVNAKVDQRDPHWAESSTSFVSNGPYILAAWKHQDQITVKKNTLYWDASNVLLSQIDLAMVTGDTELKMFEKKELNLAGSLPSALSLEAIRAWSGTNALKNKDVLGTYFIRVNTDKYPNPLLRRALALAINRGEIVEHIAGYQLLATGLVPTSFHLQKKPYFADGDTVEAQKLFAECGMETLPPLTLIYASGERNHLIAQALQQQWKRALGIDVKLEALERKVYFNRISTEDYQLASSSWIADFNDPINFLEVFKYRKGGSNNTHWENPKYIELLDASSRATSHEERSSLLFESEKLLIEEMPILPIFHYMMLYIQDPRLQDVVLSSMGIFDFKWASFSEQKTAQGERR